MKKPYLCLLAIMFLAVLSFAIEVEYHIYPGWQNISMPCSTSSSMISDYLPIVGPAYEFDIASGSYHGISEFPSSIVGFWVLASEETTIVID